MPDPSFPSTARATALPPPRIEYDGVVIYEGDSVELLPLLPAASLHSLVSDPPYGLSFNGNGWDDASGFRESLPHVDTSSMTAAEVFETWCSAWGAGALHALRPGAHAAVFGGTRTWHRMVAGLEDAGFEIRDQIAWLHTTGMPKSADLSFAIDKLHGAVRADREVQIKGDEGILGVTRSVQEKGTPVTDDTADWEGWGTALRPGYEPIIIARKPMHQTTARNVLEHDTGGINIDASRFGADRWPMNVALDQQQADALDMLTGTWQTGAPVSRSFPIFRFEHKPSPAERPRAFGISHHTVKPLGLMRWLITLITPPGGQVLEPFTGSGSTIEAAVQAGFQVVGIEKDPEFIPLIQSRLDRSH